MTGRPVVMVARSALMKPQPSQEMPAGVGHDLRVRQGHDDHQAERGCHGKAQRPERGNETAAGGACLPALAWAVTPGKLRDGLEQAQRPIENDAVKVPVHAIDTVACARSMRRQQDQLRLKPVVSDPLRKPAGLESGVPTNTSHQNPAAPPRRPMTAPARLRPCNQRVDGPDTWP